MDIDDMKFEDHLAEIRQQDANLVQELKEKANRYRTAMNILSFRRAEKWFLEKHETTWTKYAEQKVNER